MFEAGEIRVVDNEMIIESIERASRKYRPIVVKSDIIEKERLSILGRKMEQVVKGLESKARNRYKHLLPDERIISALNSFATLLGIEVIEPVTVENYHNPSKRVKPNPSLKVWKFNGVNVAIKYVIGKHVIQALQRPISFDEVIEVVSLINARLATHGLFLKYRVSTFDASYRGGGLTASMVAREFETVLNELDVSNSILKIIGLIEDEELREEEKKEIAVFIDKSHIKLSETLADLIQ